MQAKPSQTLDSPAMKCHTTRVPHSAAPQTFKRRTVECTACPACLTKSHKKHRPQVRSFSNHTLHLFIKCAREETLYQARLRPVCSKSHTVKANQLCAI
ncbi:hypothetical protein E2C01_064484 [Portunus trituberculatus]|uniref:Uncharacterized protein n=1 Tax=Portunus trituberculatus TaxID=210409 RepID=A0A5B7HG99_PORTR|nr:hypothetical protein [Portunus trituberculatus]